MDSAAEGRPLAIFGWPGRALLPSRIRFWYSFFTFLGYVGRRILCAGACTRPCLLCLGSTPESGFVCAGACPRCSLFKSGFVAEMLFPWICMRTRVSPGVRVFFLIFLEYPYFNSLSVFACARLVFLWLFSYGFCCLSGWLG